MAPAPVRSTSPRRALGYPLGVGLVVLGVIVGAVIVITGIAGLVSDIDRLRQGFTGDEIVADLEAGEYFVFDESDGIDLGPVDVRVVRAADDVAVPVRPVDDGPSYDFEGRAGEAAFAVQIPTTDAYRVEITSSAGEVVRFALGQDTGPGPASIVARGVAIGGVIMAMGLIVLVGTAIADARRRGRARLAQALHQTNTAVGAAAGSIDDPAERRRLAERTGQQASQELRARAGGSTERRHGSVEVLMEHATRGVGDVAARTTEPADVLRRVGTVLSRAQDRLAAGEPVTDVIRDVAGEARAVGIDAGVSARATAADASAEVERLRTDAVARAGELARLRDALVAHRDAPTGPGSMPPPPPGSMPSGSMPPPPPGPPPPSPGSMPVPAGSMPLPPGPIPPPPPGSIPSVASPATSSNAVGAAPDKGRDRVAFVIAPPPAALGQRSLHPPPVSKRDSSFRLAPPPAAIERSERRGEPTDDATSGDTLPP